MHNKNVWVTVKGQENLSPALLLGLEKFNCHVMLSDGTVHYLDISDIIVNTVYSEESTGLIFISQ
jgi:hypothetical protein